MSATSAGLGVDRDLRLVAQVAWVGRSSLEVAAAALTLDPESGTWTPCLTARFVVVRLLAMQIAKPGSERTEMAMIWSTQRATSTKAGTIPVQ